jgi:nucleotide-binding universal stress UspA family protein
MALDERDATTLRHAAYIAHAAGSQNVYVSYVVPPFDLPPDVAAQSQDVLVSINEETKQQLQESVAKQRNDFPPTTRIECVALQGSPVAELVRFTVQKNADLVCIGLDSQKDSDPLSDSAVNILRKAPCSTLLIPLGAEPHYERILVPVDFSEHSREALDMAAEIATSSPGAAIEVLHAYGVPLGYHKAGRTYDEFASIMRRYAERQWDEILPMLNFRGIPWTIRFVLSNKVPKTILEVAEEIDAQLIVMASHGRTRPAAVLLGHAADSVASKTKRPLFCVKKKGEVVNFLHATLQLFELE